MAALNGYMCLICGIVFSIGTICFSILIDIHDKDNYIDNEKLHWSQSESIIKDRTIIDQRCSKNIGCHGCSIQAKIDDQVCDNLNISAYTLHSTVECYAGDKCCHTSCSTCTRQECRTTGSGNTKTTCKTVFYECNCYCSLYKREACDILIGICKTINYVVFTAPNRITTTTTHCDIDDVNCFNNAKTINSTQHVWIRDTNETYFSEPDYASGYMLEPPSIAGIMILSVVSFSMFVSSCIAFCSKPKQSVPPPTCPEQPSDPYEAARKTDTGAGVGLCQV
uniref:Uncharacterized protein n=1 Tax=viral metagenome TaxID=1070528 RepID=A0A6C0ED08_9ZZZZ